MTNERVNPDDIIFRTYRTETPIIKHIENRRRLQNLILSERHFTYDELMKKFGENGQDTQIDCECTVRDYLDNLIDIKALRRKFGTYTLS